MGTGLTRDERQEVRTTRLRQRTMMAFFELDCFAWRRSVVLAVAVGHLHLRNVRCGSRNWPRQRTHCAPWRVPGQAGPVELVFSL